MVTKFATASTSCEKLDAMFGSVEEIQPQVFDTHIRASPDTRQALQRCLSKVWSGPAKIIVWCVQMHVDLGCV